MKNKKTLLIIAALLVIAVLFILPGGGSGSNDPGVFNSELNLVGEIEETPAEPMPMQQEESAEQESTLPQIAEEPEQPAEEAESEPIQEIQEEPVQEPEEEPAIDEDGWYDSKDEVALYIHTYGKLPGNYISKKDAEKLGWSGGGLDPYAPGKSIGGSHFGNYEGLLPDGHDYTECDIDTAGKSSRGAKRIVFSNDGLIYYTDDHYESFTLLYGNED